ncbi:Ger(x)C family spore germination protein [Paenibacillus oryzisoli]|uniref:Ger(x)C family spore germination protein n=1 Tax=Paenibacillus oryzisoli TaxID=1850517 RepID=UPI003D2E033B
MWKMKQGVILVCLSSLCLLTGCWNGRELHNISVVVGMGIDKNPKTDEYRLSFQVVIPNSAAVGTRGGVTTLPVVIHTASDATLFGALRKTSKLVPRQLFFAHIQQVVIGEELAKSGIGDLFDFFERSHELRLTSHVLIARGTTAEKVLRVLTPMEKNPAEGIAKRLELTSKIYAENLDTKVTDVLKALFGSGEAAISGVGITGEPKQISGKENLTHMKLPNYIQIEGIAMFKNKKLLKWLDGKEARGVLWVQNQMKNTVTNLACENKQNGLSVELTRSKTKIKVRIVQDQPIFQVKVDEEGSLGEVHCKVNPSKRAEILHIQQDWENETKQEIIATIKTAQRSGSDILGFDKVLNREYPAYWKKVKDVWPEKFEEIKVEVEVKAFIRRTGMRTKPYFFEQ